MDRTECAAYSHRPNDQGRIIFIFRTNHNWNPYSPLTWVFSPVFPPHLRMAMCAVCSVTSVVSDCELWTIACQAPLSMGFFQGRYWSGLPCPPPGDLPNPGINPCWTHISGVFCIVGMFFTHLRHLESPGMAIGFFKEAICSLKKQTTEPSFYNGFFSQTHSIL